MDTNPTPETPPESAGTADTSYADFSTLYAAAGQKAVQAAALQSLANALTLTLHNAVAEQQHSQMLRMAFTSAAASASARRAASDALREQCD